MQAMGTTTTNEGSVSKQWAWWKCDNCYTWWYAMHNHTDGTTEFAEWRF